MRRNPRWRAAACAGLLAVSTAVTTYAAAPAQAHPVNAADYQQVELAKGVGEMGEPMSLAVLPDRSVLHTSRNGQLRRTDAAGTPQVGAQLSRYPHDEEGLQGVAVDPGFASNRFV